MKKDKSQKSKASDPPVDAPKAVKAKTPEWIPRAGERCFAVRWRELPDGATHQAFTPDVNEVIPVTVLGIDPVSGIALLDDGRLAQGVVLEYGTKHVKSGEPRSDYIHPTREAAQLAAKRIAVEWGVPLARQAIVAARALLALTAKDAAVPDLLGAMGVRECAAAFAALTGERLGRAGSDAAKRGKVKAALVALSDVDRTAKRKAFKATIETLTQAWGVALDAPVKAPVKAPPAKAVKVPKVTPADACPPNLTSCEAVNASVKAPEKRPAKSKAVKVPPAAESVGKGDKRRAA